MKPETPPETFSQSVDPDFKDSDLYEVFLSEDTGEPWHVMVSVDEDGKFTHWALMQMLRAREWDIDFEWAVFMKTGRCGSSGLRHFSKKFTDGKAAFKTFREWFEEKTGNQWMGDHTSTREAFQKVPGKYSLLTAQESRILLESKAERERPRPKLGVTDVPVDIYFKDREQYQVYVTPDQDLWTAVMSIRDASRHSQYAIIQVLVAKPEEKVDFDFVVFMRQGKLGGSAQRYAKRYTVEAAALATFSQWFKEKTGNLWLGSFKDSLDEFEAQAGKFQLMPKNEWPELIEFEERSKAALIDGPIDVDSFYRDAELYRVYHTEEDDLWAAVLSVKENDVYTAFVILQLLAKKPDSVVDFDFVVFRRIGERGESGQWTAKKFTNELDALRTFKMWYAEETGNQWKGSFASSLESFQPVANKLEMLPQDEWEPATREINFIVDPPAMTAGMGRTAIQALQRAASREDKKHLSSKLPSKELIDVEIPLAKPTKAETSLTSPPARNSQLSAGAKMQNNEATPVKEASRRLRTKDKVKADVVESTTQEIKKPSQAKITKPDSQKVKEEVDSACPVKDKYGSVVLSAKLVQPNPLDKSKFYCIQLLEATANVPKDEKYCFYVRAGKVGAVGGTNFRVIGSLEQGKKAFAKKFQEKTTNVWCGDFESTCKAFVASPDTFEMVRELPKA